MMVDHKPELLILAAGIGSRYGSLKQLDTIGPNNETVMEYSIHDAINAGFGKITFVINKDFEDVFQTQIISKYKNRIRLDCVYQELDNLPAEIQCPQNRSKPWGTGHAILIAKDTINTPFAVINADDFYGSSSFMSMKKALSEMSPDSTEYCMVGYQVLNTLSDHGSVSRGVCEIKNRYLSSISEAVNIIKENDIITSGDGDIVKEIDKNSIVSMNFWGFSPGIFEILENRFELFLKENIDNFKAEFFITEPLDHAINNNLIKIKVIETNEKWFGVTYREDRMSVSNAIQKQIENGKYPHRLWD